MSSQDNAIIYFMDLYLTVDVGGTQLRAALYPTDSTKAVRQMRIPTKGKGTPLERLLSLLTDIWPANDRVLGIGMALPGPLNPQTGVLFSAPNIPGWENLPLGSILKERFGVPVFLGNDANLAGMGEWRYGAARGYHDVLYMTISTGIGGGVIINDRLLLGHNGLAAELGHVTVLPDGPLCGCGQRGHIESVGSGTGIAHYVAAELAKGRKSALSGTPSARDISEAAAAGDELAGEALARAGHFVGVALADFCHIFNPEIIILGGGVSRAGEIFMQPLRTALEEHVITPAYTRDLKVAHAALGDDVGLLGALALVSTSLPA